MVGAAVRRSLAVREKGDGGSLARCQRERGGRELEEVDGKHDVTHTGGKGVHR